MPRHEDRTVWLESFVQQAAMDAGMSFEDAIDRLAEGKARLVLHTNMYAREVPSPPPPTTVMKGGMPRFKKFGNTD